MRETNYLRNFDYNLKIPHLAKKKTKTFELYNIQRIYVRTRYNIIYEKLTIGNAEDIDYNLSIPHCDKKKKKTFEL